MKIEALAGLTGKPVDELATALSVEVNDDQLSDEIVGKVLTDYVKEVRSQAKTEGRGWGTREIQAKLKKAGLEGDDIDTILEDLTAKLAVPKNGNPDEKLQRKYEQLEAKYNEVTGKYEGLVKQKESEKRDNLIMGKLATLRKEFQTTDKAFDLAIKNLLSSLDVDIDGEDIFVKKPGGVGYLPKSIEDIAKTHLSEYFEPAKAGGTPPPNPPKQDQKPAPKPEDRNQLIIKSRTANSPEERAAALEALEQLAAEEA